MLTHSTLVLKTPRFVQFHTTLTIIQLQNFASKWDKMRWGYSLMEVKLQKPGQEEIVISIVFNEPKCTHLQVCKRSMLVY